MQKNKNVLTNIDHIASEVGEHIALSLMLVATTIGLMDASSRVASRTLVPASVTFSQVLNDAQLINPMRREREEVGVHYISYAEAQRTPPRSKSH